MRLFFSGILALILFFGFLPPYPAVDLICIERESWRNRHRQILTLGGRWAQSINETAGFPYCWKF
jgi:hypothetical protein